MQMDPVTIAIVVLCLAGAVALVALAYLLVNLVKTLKATMAKVDPIIDDMATITSDLKPTVSKVDPMMDRITLTIDAANLELMRVDQIMEDVNTVSGNLAKASSKIETASSAPLDLVSGMASKIRSFVNPISEQDSFASAAAQAIDENLAGVEDCIAEKQADLAGRKVEAAHACAVRDEAQDKVNAGASDLKNGVLSHISADTE